jgi:cysteine synthase A
MPEAELGGNHTSPTREWIINRINENPLLSIKPIPGLTQCTVMAQCEFFAPTGSHKDHMYADVIQHLEEQGKISPGMSLIDYSSGNGGAALSYVTGLLGYRAIIVRPAGMSAGKAAQITAFGGRLVETPAQQGVEGAVAGARRIARELGDRAYFIDQGESDYNHLAYRQLATRIADQLSLSNTKVDQFVCALGTGGTFSGIASVLREKFPGTECIAVDIEGETSYAHHFGSARLSADGQPLEGVSTGVVFGQAKSELTDRVIIVSPDEAYDACRTLWRNAYLFAGPTSGANLAAISKLGLESSTALTIFFDAAWKYFDDEKLLQRALRDGRTTLAAAMGFLQLGKSTTGLDKERDAS